MPPNTNARSAIRGRSQIVGLENHSCRNGSETRHLVMTHIRALRAQECLRDAAIVLIGEDNLGNETQEVAEEVLRDVSGASALTRTPGRYGVRTDAGC